MTLNDLERRNNLYFAFFSHNSTDFQADYVIASWNPTHRTRIYTRCSAIAERPRCRVRYSFRQK